MATFVDMNKIETFIKKQIEQETAAFLASKVAAWEIILNRAKEASNDNLVIDVKDFFERIQYDIETFPTIGRNDYADFRLAVKQLERRLNSGEFNTEINLKFD